MKSFIISLGLLASISRVSCHYIYHEFSLAGEVGAPFVNVRQTPTNSPVIDLTSNDLRCNVGGASGAGVGTLAVTAGAKVQFTSDVDVYHNGPTSVYLAKAPTTAAEFDGSGEVWFKILDLGATFPGGTWELKGTYEFTLPTCLPNGEYLVRIQQLGIHNPWPAGIPQFYIGCAQISVTGGGTSDLGPKVAIPGAFAESDPGYTVNIYNNFESYTVPGPAVATC